MSESDAHAGFPAMRRRARELAPDDGGVLEDSGAFFRRGRSGAGREVLTGEQLVRYHARAAQLVPADLLAWLHREPDPTNVSIVMH